MATQSSPLLDALALRAAPVTPVWFMRQAGRSLPEYRAIRGTDTLFRMLDIPDVAANITMQPVQRYGVDAAILYSDIMAPLKDRGLNLDIVPGRGPVIDPAVRTPSDLKALRPLDPGVDLCAMEETVRICAHDLAVPLIGFAGAPFTVASYLIEGAPSRDYAITKTLMRTEPDFWNLLMDELIDTTVTTLEVQVKAGARALQLFDSWIGALSRGEYSTFIAPHMRRLLGRLEPLAVPIIYFGVGTTHLLDEFAALPIAAIGIDWRVDLEVAAKTYGKRFALQGNLDPTIVLAGVDFTLAGVESTLKQSREAPGYIFNLGHGVLPQTDPGVLAAIVGLVHERGVALRSDPASLS